MKTGLFSFVPHIRFTAKNFAISNTMALLASVTVMASTTNSRANQTVTLPTGANFTFVSCQVLGSPNNNVNNASFLVVPPALSTTLSGNLILHVWNCVSFNDYTYYDDADSPSGSAGWFDDSGANPVNVIWNPGRGMVIRKLTSASATLTLVGTPPVAPSFPPNNYCGCTTFSLLGAQTPNISGTYDNVMGFSPQPGTWVQRWVENGYVTYTNSCDGWSPSAPILTNGEAAYFYVPCNPVPCNTNPCPAVTITCPTNITTNICGSSVVVNYPAPIVTDGALKSSVPASGSSFNVGTTVVICTATNACSTNTCAFNVTVLQIPAVAITCPTNITTNICGNSVVVNYPSPIVTGGALKSSLPVSGSLFSLGTTVVTCTATNACSTNICTFNVTVLQIPAVIITCPAPITTNSCSNAVVNFPNPTVTGGALKSCVPPSGSSFNVGTTTVTCTATNACFTNTCTFNVTVTCPLTNLPCGDDLSKEVPLCFPICICGTLYTNLWLNYNGNVTFGGPFTTFTPGPLGNAGLPIIAPFWADVDSCRGGTLSYGCTTYYVNEPLVGNRPAMVFQWDNVGYYNRLLPQFVPTALRNTFRLTIIDRSLDRGPGEFDFEFFYEKIEWETGDASQPATVGSGLGGPNSARAGYACGLQNSYELAPHAPGTFLDGNGSRPLKDNSLNSTVPGAYYFYVTNCVPTTNTPVAANRPPVADAGPNRIVCPTVTNCCAFVQLDGSLSYDPDGDQLYFTWFDNHGNLISDSDTPTVKICDPGDHVFRLEVYDGQQSSVAYVHITINDCTPLTNDDCTNAIPLLAGSICGSTECATPSAANSLPALCVDSINSPDVWYTFTPQCNGQITIDTCGSCTNQSRVFDTVLSVYTGTCGSLIQVPGACSDDIESGSCYYQSRVTFNGVAGVTYRIRVGGYGLASGPFQLNISTSYLPPVNDECTNAIPLFAGSPAACGSTVCATPSLAGSIATCNSSADAPDVWYTYTPQCDGQITIDTCGECANPPGNFNTVLSVYTGTCGSLIQVPGACNDDYTINGPFGIKRHPCGHQSRVAINGIAGVTYYIRVAGFSGASGPFRLNLSQGAPPVPANDWCTNATPVVNGTYRFSTCNANTDGPTGPLECQPIHDVWFRFTAPCSGQVSVDTCKSSFDTVLAIYTGTCGNLTLTNCNNDATNGVCSGSLNSRVQFNAVANTTYYIRVGGYHGATGWGLLTIQGPYPPLGTCIQATPPAYPRAFRIMGPPNNIPWSWSISVACCINLGTNVPGVPTSDGNGNANTANTLATAFANSINAACLDGGVSAVAYPNPNKPGLMVVNVSSCTGTLNPFIFRVGPVGASEQDQCVVADVTGDDPLPITGNCSFNPEIVEVPLAHHDFNGNGVDDAIDIMLGTSADLNGNGIPDEAESCLAPEFTANADSRVVQIGDTVTLTVAASGTAPLQYQWSLAEVPLNEGGAISGSKSNTLTIQNVASTNLGDYSVTVSNACGVISSVPTTLSTETVARPLLSKMAPLKGTFQFAFQTKSGRTYVVEYQNNLSDPSWTPLETVIGDGLEHIVVDPVPLPAKRFYRVRMTDP